MSEENKEPEAKASGADQHEDSAGTKLVSDSSAASSPSTEGQESAEKAASEAGEASQAAEASAEADKAAAGSESPVEAGKVAAGSESPAEAGKAAAGSEATAGAGVPAEAGNAPAEPAAVSDADKAAKAQAAAEARAARAAAREAAKAAGGDSAAAPAAGESAAGDADPEAKAKAAAEARAARAAAREAAKAGESAAPEAPKEPSPLQPRLDRAVELLKQHVAADAVAEAFINERDGHRPYLVIAPQHWVETARFLRDHEELQLDYLRNVSGIDQETHMESAYHLISLATKHEYCIKVKTDREQPSIPSITPIWATANWNEREIFDLLGIDFPGHPDLRRIMMPDDWVGHPLRKDYEPIDPEV